MSEVNYKFHIERDCHYQPCDSFETLDKAQEYARSQAWAQGEDYVIYKAIGVAKKPEMIKEISIETVK